MGNLSNQNIIHHQDSNISYIQFRRLLEFPELKHAFTTNRRLDFRTHRNNKKHPNYNQSLKNIESLTKTLGCGTYTIKINLGHTNNVIVPKRRQRMNLKYPSKKEIDGIITNKKEQSLIATSADCIIFFLYDPVKKVIGNVHSGWRGTHKKIIVEAIKKMQSEFSSCPADIICCICPSIRQCHFEVGEDVYKLYCKAFPNYQDTIIKKGEKWHIDTIEINKRLLLKCGLKAENIIDSQICTVCHSDEINSCRAHKENFKLNAGLIELR